VVVGLGMVEGDRIYGAEERSWGVSDGGVHGRYPFLV